MSELIEDIVGQKAVEQVDSLTDKIIRLADLISKTNEQGRKLEFDLKGAKNIEDTVNLMDKLQSNTVDVNKVAGEWQKTMRETDSLLKNFGTNLEQNIRVQLNYKGELKAVKDELKLLAKETDAYGNTTSAAKDKIVLLTQKEKELKVAIGEAEQLIKAQAKANAANAGSIDQMSAKLGQYRDIFRQLSAEDRNGKIGQDLLATVQKLDPTIKAFDASIGNFQRNVGNYGGSFASAFNVLNNELTETRAKLSGMAASDSGFDQLKAKEQALEQTTNGLNKSFTSTKQELREFQEAAKQLGLNLGEDSAAFTQFAAEVGKSKDEISDLQARVDFNASDTKYLDGTIQGVQALAGVYGIAEGASSLFGTSQEELQKQLVTLQSIMVITNGLQQVQLVLQSDSAAMQTLLAVQTKVLSAAKAVENAINNASTVATEGNTIAKIQNRAATIANAVATTASSAATTLYTFVTGGATVATKLFRAALLATGIGAIVVLLGAAVEAMSAFSAETSKATDDIESYTKAMNEMADVTNGANKIIDRNAKIAMAAAKARGADVKELAAIEESASKLKIRNLQDELEVQNEILKSGTVSQEKYDIARKRSAELSNQIAEAEAETEVKKFDRIADARNKSQDAAKKASDERKKQAEEDRKNSDALNAEIMKIRISFLEPTEEEIKSAVEQIQQIVDGQGGKIYLDATIAVDMDNIQKDIDVVDKELNERLLGIESAYAQGLYKSVEAYEADKLNATIEGSQKRYSVEIESLKKILDFIPQNAEQRKSIEDKLRELELKQLEETNKLKVDKDKDTNEKIVANKKLLNEKLKQLGAEAFDAAVFFIDASFAKKQQEVDSDLRANERKKESDINYINASTLSQEEKIQRIAEANLVANAKEEQLERKKVELQRRQALYDRGITIAKITMDTASAVIAMLKTGPQGIPLSIAAGVTGALQLAKAISAPLPKYELGVDNAPGGLAITDEKGPEGYIESDGKTFIGSNKGPTLRYVKPGTKIIPHDELMKMTTYSMMGGYPVLPEYNETKIDLTEVSKKIDVTNNINKQMLRQLTKQRPTTIIDNSSWAAYERNIKH